MAHATEYTNKKECEVKALPYEEKERLVKEGKAHWFFPHHVVEQVLMCLALVMILVTLSTLAPAHLGPKADPFDTPAHIKPEWYFLAAFYSLKVAQYFEFLGAWAPKILGIAVQGAAVGALIMVPWLDRGDPKVRHPKKRPIAMAAGAAAAFIVVLFSILGLVA
jgi:quinol-cytochrome oxidoreductase complex cytochrome b subunit